MISLVEVSNDLLGGINESLLVDLVGDVGVEVVLEVLEHFKVVLDVIVVSDSWEGESFVVQFPGMNSWWSSTNLAGNFKSIVQVLDSEVS